MTSLAFLAVLPLLVAAIIWAIVRAVKSSASPADQLPAHIGYTHDGQPIYPVVGYTADGRAVTADRAVGLRPGGTNSMAIVALITALTVAPLGIVFGHIALSQINRSGQDGRAFAVAGLVLGYVGLVTWIIAAIVWVAVLNGAIA